MGALVTTTGLPITGGSRLGSMSSGKSLSQDENARVVESVRELLTRFEGNQTKLAPNLGIKQPTLSALLRGQHQAGYALARRVAMLQRVDVDVLLSGKIPQDVYPNRAKVIAMLSDELDPSVISKVAAIDMGDDGDQKKWWWADVLISEQVRFDAKSKPSSARLHAQPKKR